MGDEEEAAYGGTFAFAFSKVLRVTSGDLVPVGALVTVLGRVRDEDGTEWYAVTAADGDSIMLPRPWLTTTGRRLRREDFYDGTSIRVDAKGHALDRG